MKFIVNNGGKLSGDIRVPGDQSISHSSIIFGGIADGEEVHNLFLYADKVIDF